MSYRLTTEAAKDIRRIHSEGTKIFGREQADKYHFYLRNIFAAIGDNPLMAHERKEITPPVRIHPCGSHLVVYVVNTRNEVTILAVRHYRENWKPQTR